MSSLNDLFRSISELFDFIKNHDKFIVRNRVYRGGGDFKQGLVSFHAKYQNIMQIFLEVPKQNLLILEGEIETILEKINDSLNLVSNIDLIISHKKQVVKYIDVVRVEILDLNILMHDALILDPSDMKSKEEIESEFLKELQLKAEDNLDQITKSFEWKRNQALLQTTLDGKELIAEHLINIEKAKKSIIKVINRHYLELLSNLANIIRNSAAKNFETIGLQLPLFITISNIFHENKEIKLRDHINGSQFSPLDVKQDVERLLNTGRISWLTSLHTSIVEDPEDLGYITEFAETLLRLSSDPKEQFLWTMSYVARAQNSEELKEVSLAFAKLASSLLTLVNDLESAGKNDLVSEVLNLNDINPMESISDIGELYQINKIDVNNLIRGIKARLRHLKNLTFQILTFEDLRSIFFTIVQFTDANAELTNIDDLEDYIRYLGT